MVKKNKKQDRAISTGYDNYCIKYKGDFEPTIATQLLKNNKSFRYETLKLRYTIPSSVHTYTPDFILRKKDGSDMIIECKGGGPMYGLTPKTITKMLQIKKTYPQLDIRFVFSNGHLKVGQGKGLPKTTYLLWAIKHDFPAAHKTIPLAWLEELI